MTPPGGGRPEPLFTADGVRLERHSWPPRGRARGTVLIAHGLGEHAERYVRLAADLSAARWAVQAWDQRGHGASEGARGAIATPTSLVDDMALVVRTLRDEQVPQPLVLLGQGLGGVVATRFLAGRSGAAMVDALVLSSPAFRLRLPPWRRLQLMLGAQLAPDRSLPLRIAPAWRSRDPLVLRRWLDDTLVHDRITPRLARFIQGAGRETLDAAPRWRTPTLLLWSGADRCVVPRASAAFAAAVPARLLARRCFDGLAHELFNEPERDLVVGALLAWLQGSVAAR